MYGFVYVLKGEMELCKTWEEHKIIVTLHVIDIVIVFVFVFVFVSVIVIVIVIVIIKSEATRKDLAPIDQYKRLNRKKVMMFSWHDSCL